MSLIFDQVASLQSRGVKPAIFSGNSGVDNKLLATDRDVLEEKYRLLFSAPAALTGFSVDAGASLLQSDSVAGSR